MNIDTSKNEFQKFLVDFEKLKQDDISESDTRSKIIDRIFVDILGWRDEDFQREGHVDSGYYDYKLSIPGFLSIIEAKKQFVDFILPLNTKKSSINSIFKENEDVIKQIRNYTTDTGIDFGIITNGHQFIIGQFVNHNGKPWKNNQVLLFNGFTEIENRFVEFYNNLAKKSIIHNGGFEFLQSDFDEKPQKIISTLIDRDKEIVRNTISSNIAPLIDMIFGEIFNDAIEDNNEFIQECFVENKETIKNRDELNRLFCDNPPDLNEVNKARNLESIVSQLENEITTVPIIAKETAPPKPIIIVGTKGAGKTTFINYLFKNKLSKDSLKVHPFVYVDFIKYYKEDKTIDTEKISGDILETLYDNYSDLKLHSSNVLKRIYFKEIRRNDESIWENLKNQDENTYSLKINDFFEQQTKQKQKHLEFLSRYLIRERHLRLIIVIDNADQFDLDVQEKVFLFANSLNRSAFCGVFISLREGYYYKWRFRPPFNAFASNVYHVSAPPYSEILQRRIDFTLKKISITADKTSGFNNKGYKIEIDNHNIIEFLSGLQNSLFDDYNQSIIDFLNYSTFPNIREGLKLFKLFLISGYTDVHEYILRVRFNQNESSIPIPFHEFIKSIGLYNKLYYNSEISVIPNLFYPCEGSNDHFIKIWILKSLLDKLEIGGNISKFERYTKLIDDFTNFGYKLNIINQSILDLLNQELIESEEVLSDIKWNQIPDSEFNIAISPKGFYYIKNFKNSFSYIDMVLQDTPIFNNDYFVKIKSVFPISNENGQRNIDDRVQTVQEFMNYLENQENHQAKSILNKFGSLINDIKANGLNADIDRITNRKYR